MPRAAAGGSNYSFVLRDDNTGRYRGDVVIQLPSVTSIIGRVLAKTALVPWSHRTTVDYLSGLVSVLRDMGTPDADIVECLLDHDELHEYLKDNRLRPEDTTKDASERGTAGHLTLERLGAAGMEDEEIAQKIARETLNNHRATPWDKGIAGWWLERNPVVVASEIVCISLRHRFIGTCDLIWRNSEDLLTVTDLKTREPGKGVYQSDHTQVGGYAIAWEEMMKESVDRTTVLVVRGPDDWTEETPTFDVRSVFLNLVKVYEELTDK